MAGSQKTRVLGLGVGLALGAAALKLLDWQREVIVPEPPPLGSCETKGIWLSPAELFRLPTAGPAWENLVRYADEPIAAPNVSDQDDPTNVRVLANALVAVRRGDAQRRAAVENAISAAIGTEPGARVLALGREVLAYVLAADLIELCGEQKAQFNRWVQTIAHASFADQTLTQVHETRPNNWGTHAGATRIAIAMYLNDEEELARAAAVFRGWVGEADGAAEFRFGERSWHPDNLPASGINPVGARREGRDVDGVLPDDQRRGGPFRWPPPQENYVYEALQGAVAQAWMLSRQGFDAWSWGDRAIYRALRWLNETANYPAAGDDTWIPHLVNWAYCAEFPAPVPARPGKGIGFADWTHADSPCRRQ